jgi:hypothetical protein
MEREKELLTITPDLRIDLTQRFFARICCIDGLIGGHSARERHSRIVQNIENASIPDIAKLSVFNATIWSRGTYL